MDSKLEAHIDEIFIDVPKTDKMVTMINRIKSKANSKFCKSAIRVIPEASLLTRLTTGL